MQRQLSTGEVAREAKISEHRVRAYADAGLLPCERDATGKRFFAPDAPSIARAVFEQRYGRVVCKEENMKKAIVTDRLQGDTMEQRTDEWHQARLGKVTASRVADVIAKTAKGYGASRENYMAQLICERLTGKPTEGFSSAAMEWGTQTEPQARAAYSARTGELVSEVGFMQHPSIEGAGASPDGIVGEGLIEIKCPNTATHLEYVLAGKPPEKYVTQMLWQMACTGAAWCDFASYDPRLPEHLQLLIVRVPRNEFRIAELEDEVRKFLAELDEKVAKLKEIKL